MDQQLKEQLFPSEFILDYIKEDAGRQRFLSYTLFRFLSFAGSEDATLPSLLKANLSCSFFPEDFSTIEDYLQADYYFSPSLAADSYEPFYLYAAISLAADALDGKTSFIDELISRYAPSVAGLPAFDTSIDFSRLIQTGAYFYAALYLATVRDTDMLPILLPLLTEAYQEEYHFTCEDYILFDFMDEYFEEKYCRRHPSFVEMVDTLVAATLNYYNTDFGTLLEHEIAQNLSGTASRFAGTKRFGSLQLPSIADTDNACRMLAELFRYAAIYELRSNLFDFHLDEDKLITLTNWKENLRWHYVQYANVYEMALDSFHAAMLARTLLKQQFTQNLASI